jgi:hypothetical protein
MIFKKNLLEHKVPLLTLIYLKPERNKNNRHMGYIAHLSNQTETKTGPWATILI